MKNKKGKSKTDAISIKIAERRRKALALRRAGLTYHQIGPQLGVSYKTAFMDVTAELKAIPKEEADALRALEAERLDALQRRFEKKDDGHGLLKVSESRRRLFGLDAPQKVSVDEIPVRIVKYEVIADKSDDNGD